jgi:hypothetical protein
MSESPDRCTHGYNGCVVTQELQKELAVVKVQHEAYGETLKEIKSLLFKACLSMAFIVAFINAAMKFIPFGD